MLYLNQMSGFEESVTMAAERRCVKNTDGSITELLSRVSRQAGKYDNSTPLHSNKEPLEGTHSEVLLSNLFYWRS